ncbi:MULTISPECIES: DUF4429 domain-containing protein [Nocardiopsis]|uniref:Short C-terminal domain-containing protein n=1 Tax=Nocardiopsis sinuspersici TaxID=501010 RepID=A0A1V3C3Z8_9ACTN|nr:MULTISPECIES: DUF4429 domain-containing protein [Nocardiopsis]OOC55413.1 hypothetical protein NOSIN_17655 [Nocardiopsis sinuspersici]
MDELRGDQAVWVFDGESVAIRYEGTGWSKDPLLRRIGRLELPVAAIAGVDFRPGADRRRGWVLRLRLRDRMDPYTAVGAALREESQPFRLTGPARSELVAEYLADQTRFAAERHTEPPAPDTVLRLVPRLPLHIQTSEGTATVDDSGVRLVWSGARAGGRKRRAQRREYDLAEITGVEWTPSDGWEWGYLRVATANSAREGSTRLRQDLNVLLADEGAQTFDALLMAATITAHMWAGARPGSGGRETGNPVAGLRDPRWWLDKARAVGQIGGVGGARAEPPAAEGPSVDRPAREEGASGGVRGGADTEWVFRQIERLGELHARGLLTDEEFSAKKAELLGRI